LSVRFTAQVDGRLGRLVPERGTAVSAAASYCCTIDDVFEPNQPTEVAQIDGIWDLAIVGSGRRWLERMREVLMDGTAQTPLGQEGVLVHQPDGAGCHLKLRMVRYLDIGTTVHEPPVGAHIVVRTTALTDLKARMGQSAPADPDKPSSLDKPLGTRERTTLLTVIAALASVANVDVTATTKAAGIIEAAASGLGVRIGKRTIEEYLKRIPDALERRR